MKLRRHERQGDIAQQPTQVRALLTPAARDAKPRDQTGAIGHEIGDAGLKELLYGHSKLPLSLEEK